MAEKFENYSVTHTHLNFGRKLKSDYFQAKLRHLLRSYGRFKCWGEQTP